MSNPDDFLLGGGAGSAFGKDDPVGTTVTGTIAVTPTVQVQTDIATGKPLAWENGDPKEQLVVTIQTALRADEDDDGKRNLYVKGSKKAGSKSMHDAVASAVRASGAKGLAVGGTLTVQFVGTEPSQTRGFNDRKLYAATYEPPAAAANGFLGVDQTQAPAQVAPVAAPVQAAVAATPAAPAPTANPAELATQLIEAGLDDADIANATSLPMAVIAALRAKAAAAAA